MIRENGFGSRATEFVLGAKEQNALFHIIGALIFGVRGWIIYWAVLRAITIGTRIRNPVTKQKVISGMNVG